MEREEMSMRQAGIITMSRIVSVAVFGGYRLNRYRRG
jgi:hypothetical protein